MLLNGSDLQLYVKRNPLGYIPVAFSTSCEIETEAEEIDRTNKDSEAWADKFLGSKSFTLTCDSLYENFKFGGFMDMFANLDQALEVFFQFKKSSGTGKYYFGDGIIVSLVLKGENEVGAEYRMVLAASGGINEGYT